MILFVYVAGALTVIAVMMALRGYAPFLFGAGAGAVATGLVMRLPPGVAMRVKRRPRRGATSRPWPRK